LLRIILSGTTFAEDSTMDGLKHPPPALVVFDRVGKSFGSKAVFEDLSFEIARNEFVLLLGPSGAGKSTVIRLIAALDRPTRGEIHVGGQPLGRIARHALPHLRRSIGIVLQDMLLLDDRTVLHNVALPGVAAGLPWREAKTRAVAALQRVGLTEADGDTRPEALSGSARQRAALARALVNRPALLLIDEPTAHLDHTSATAVMRLLEQFVEGGVTVVATSETPAARLPGRARVIAIEPAA
jgi:cell division transport system ATP-binding protein